MTLNLMSRDVSSVGSERCFDRAEVTGSSPVRPTILPYCSCFLSNPQQIEVHRSLQITGVINVPCDSLDILEYCENQKLGTKQVNTRKVFT